MGRKYAMTQRRRCCVHASKRQYQHKQVERVGLNHPVHKPTVKPVSHVRIMPGAPL
mgnify:CR=1 FL=1